MAKPKPVLLVEDDSIDVMVVKRVLQEFHASNEVVCTINGEEALAYLRGKEGEKPCVILLDLNMPKMNGLEFLRVVKAEERLKDIPVVVVTTSAEEQDMVKSFELGAAAYIVKSFSYGDFRERMKSIETYLVAVPSPEQ